MRRTLFKRVRGVGQEPGLPTPRVHHTTVECAEHEVDSCKQFYCDVLGLTLVESPVAHSMWFKEGVHLYWGAGPPPRHPELPPPPNHFALVLGDAYWAIRAACRGCGLFLQDLSEFCWSVNRPSSGTEYGGSPRCYIQDPAGNRIELMESAPQ